MPRHRRSTRLVMLSAFTLLFVGCLSSGPPLLPAEEDEGAQPIGFGEDAAAGPRDVDLGDPFSLDGLSPSHGPFTGGVHASLTGRGFSSNLRVFFGDVEVAHDAILASDAAHAAVVTPAGVPGFVDIRIRDDKTAQERVLVKGYHYDAFVVSPSSGATSGGTRITLTGSQTQWTSASRVAIDGSDCTDVVVKGPTSIACVTPAGSPGVKMVTVTTGASAGEQARDAFTYTDGAESDRGGLSGGALAGAVRVVARDALTGLALPGAFAIAGSTLDAATIRKTDASGAAELPLGAASKITVTVAAKCHQPVTFVDVPVDTVTAYLSPVLEWACAEGDPPSTAPNGGRYGGVIEGELVFPQVREFTTAWTNVPFPSKPTERRAAYVFQASASRAEPFTLPPPDAAITPETPGANGYPYSLVVYPGNVTLYVVAGLEDRSETPPRFLPYVMGVARGITVPTQTRVSGVDIAMNVLFDHKVTVAPTVPPPGPRGPDRLATSLAVTLGAAGYAILPRGASVVPLPAPATVPFIGVPSLDHALSGEQYVLGAFTGTGPSLSVPSSVVSLVRTSDANGPVAMGGFIGVPTLQEPAEATWSGRHVRFSGGENIADLSVTRVRSRSGLVTWTIIAPKDARSFDVPDLAALPGPDAVGLGHGAIHTTVYLARIDAFDYGALDMGQLSPRAFNAYSVDSVAGTY